MKKTGGPISNLNLRQIAVTGMDCTGCATKVEKAVKRMPGIVSARITFPLGKLNVEYDYTLTGVQQVIEKVNELNYGAYEEVANRTADDNKTTSFFIEGMDCADCAAKLEKRINKVPGVEQAQVYFATSRMVVHHLGPTEEIMSIIKKMGYSGTIDEGCSQKPESVSTWNSNRHIIPTAIALTMLVMGLIAGWLGAPGEVANALFLVGIIMGGYLQAKNGISVLINARELDMNVLTTVAVIGAAVIGQFEEAAVVVFLFSLGNALQIYTLDKTRNSIRSLMELAPNQALIRRNGAEIILLVEEIVIGDVMIVHPGERIPMDGRVLKGFSSVNQASITGESLPVDKNVGDEVYAGTINECGALEIVVTKLAKDNTIARIISMVADAQEQHAPAQQFIDKFAKYHTPLVILGAVLVAAIPPLAFGQPFNKWFYEGMAMLLVACPCALVISTPVSIVSAIGGAAKRGVLIKGGVYLEEAGDLSVIAFDKTGTLTVGQPQVTDVISISGTPEQELIAIAAAIESRSEHPLGSAILKYARERRIPVPPVVNFKAVLGLGAKGEVNGKAYQIGNTKFFTEEDFGWDKIVETVIELQNEGKTVMLLGGQEKIVGIIAAADVIRENSWQAIDNLKNSGIKKVIMLTGDNKLTAQAIAGKAGIDDFRADLLPEDKVAVIRELLAQYGKVAMVGDGVNDAPAMALATVGIAMGAAGTDAALETADIALMDDDITKLTFVMKLSRDTIRIIKQNIIFALTIKVLIFLLIIPGWLTLWLAVAGDMGTSLLATLNAMSLLRARY